MSPALTFGKLFGKIQPKTFELESTNSARLNPDFLDPGLDYLIIIKNKIQIGFREIKSSFRLGLKESTSRADHTDNSGSAHPFKFVINLP
ncbi:hypothetical protein C1645_836956 [Glomus cerebriforme]|uniref:Uncharacterized protein n=1 Tax=Glomus cerebriforme TaxID=658196 RepID=A0A397SB08_9GLOM|nr:hypothetical protein C1645_836956 [Glomus cerebriforme]